MTGNRVFSCKPSVIPLARASAPSAHRRHPIAKVTIPVNPLGRLDRTIVKISVCSATSVRFGTHATAPSPDSIQHDPSSAPLYHRSTGLLLNCISSVVRLHRRSDILRAHRRGRTISCRRCIALETGVHARANTHAADSVSGGHDTVSCSDLLTNCDRTNENGYAWLSGIHAQQL